jgi:L,D-transpeptidase YcbB
VIFVDGELLPSPASPERLAATNPIYAALRTVPASSNVRRDLDRLALIGDRPRFVLVDTAGARLWMIEDGRVAGSMKVVVGKPGMDTPMMAALIRYAVLDPYWHLPPDLVRQRVAEHYWLQGPRWLRDKGLEPVTGYGPNAARLDPEAIDWPAVANGEAQVGLRQQPGPLNTMGAVKFMFPNDLGIYLHDTPERRLFRAAERRFSSGCVRLEKAGELYRWLMETGLPLRDLRNPERRVDLPAPVPVFILDLPSLKHVALPEMGGRAVAAAGHRTGSGGVGPASTV